jgi:2,5-diketo-D-gluconate reductase A
MTHVPTIRLANGIDIPRFGFGVFQIPPEETEQAVRAAFDAGYRHVDTAQMHGNEEGVGAALAGSGLAARSGPRPLRLTATGARGTAARAGA